MKSCKECRRIKKRCSCGTNTRKTCLTDYKEKGEDAE